MIYSQIGPCHKLTYSLKRCIIYKPCQLHAIREHRQWKALSGIPKEDSETVTRSLRPSALDCDTASLIPTPSTSNSPMPPMARTYGPWQYRCSTTTPSTPKHPSVSRGPLSHSTCHAMRSQSICEPQGMRQQSYCPPTRSCTSPRKCRTSSPLRTRRLQGTSWQPSSAPFWRDSDTAPAERYPATPATSGEWPAKPKTQRHDKHPARVFLIIISILTKYNL